MAGLVVGLTMLLAMSDYVSGATVVPTVGWAAVLLLLALIISATSSIRDRRSGAAGSTAMALHRGLRLVLGAGLLLGRSTGAVTVQGHEHGVTGAPAAMVLTAAAVAYIVFAVVTVRRGLHATPDIPGSRLRRWFFDGTIDIVGMTAGTAATAVMLVFA